MCWNAGIFCVTAGVLSSIILLAGKDLNTCFHDNIACLSGCLEEKKK